MSNGREIVGHMRFIWPVAAIIALAGNCLAIHVSTDYSHSANFAQYHTYSWLKVQAGDSLWADRIRRDVNAQLSARGWREVPSGGQAEVAAFAATSEKPTLETFYSGFGPAFGGWCWGGGWSDGIATTEVVYTPIGSLVVDIYSNQNKHLLWRSVSTQALSSKPVKNERKLAKAVDKMFRKFPPPSLG
jgi:Domain of unknown function (DUF4136)